ncbi:MAG: TRAP transporter permease [Campylobacterales bacterium]|nr:TRAP transporter permease [Campylobacterales bacterium]
MIVVIAFLWSLYQLYVVIVPTNSVFIRSTHLAFALALAFMMYPMFRSSKTMRTIPWYNFLIMPAAVFTSLYIYLFYDALNARNGSWTTADVIVGILGIILLLKATRRTLGLALPIIAIIFLIYDHLGQSMPDIIAHKGASINKIVGQMFLTTEGIFGVPLGVSASYVFLFVLFGALLDKAGAGKYFIDLAYALLGKYDGGPAKASVAASGMMGIISGSSIANTVTTGTFTIPLMKKLGFPGYKAASVEVAASTNGQLMPPIMGAAAFIIAEFLGLAYTDVIMAAAIPAFASYFALFYIVHLEAKKLGIVGEDPAKFQNAFTIFKSGMHYIIPIFFLIYTLIVLRQSPQSAAFNAIVFIMLIMVTQHPVKAWLKNKKVTRSDFLVGFYTIGEGMVSGAKNMVPIAIATAVAGIVVGSVTLTGIGLTLADVITQLSGGYIVGVLFLTAVVSLILGMGLPTTANYIVMASLTAPIIMELAGDLGYLIPAIAAHMFVLYFGILADDTPPVGMAAYAAAGIAKSDPIRTGLQGFAYDIRTAILPFAFFFNNKLLLIKSVDAAHLKDPSTWQWVTNPFEIALIFVTAVIGMFAFSSAVQGWVRKKTTIVERALLLMIAVSMLVPNIVMQWLHLGSEYTVYALGAIVYLMIYITQVRSMKSTNER